MLFDYENIKNRKTDNNYEIDIDFVINFRRNIYVENFEKQIMKKDKLIILESIGKGKTGEVYKIIENQTNQIYILKIINDIRSISLNFIKIDIFEDLLKRNKSFENNKIYEEETKNHHIQLFGSDNFTNQSLIHIILNKILGVNQNYLYQHSCFAERKKGYNITEYANRLDLHQYLGSIIYVCDRMIYNLMKQIISVLNILKTEKYGFNHSDLKTKNIFVLEKDVDTIIYKIADFDKSSIFYNKIRFYNNSYNWRIGKYSKTPFPMKYDEKYKYEYYCLYDINFYENFGFHEYIMSNPHGFYTSFDYYTFFYSLILEPIINQYMLSNPESKIWKIYKYLFHYDEKEEWIKFINDIKTSENIQSIYYFWNKFYDNKYKLLVNVDFITKILDKPYESA